jgi:riboflavin kinase
LNDNPETKITPYLWFTLYKLLKQGSGRGLTKISTNQLAELLGISQQSASRHLSLLEKIGFITRKKDSRGSKIQITSDGMKSLEEIYYTLKRHFEEEEALYFEGTVFSGMFQGRYYITQEGYHGQIRKKLGFDPYPGTLNLKLEEPYVSQRRKLEGLPAITLEGFKVEDRAFGGAKCYPLVINDEIEGALIIADRTSYDYSVMEIISAVNLREYFKLEDGDSVKILFTN